MKTVLKNRNLLLFLCLTIAASCAEAQVSVWDGTTSPWTQGTGTATDPFLIENAQQLAYLAERVNKGLDTLGGKVSNPNHHYKLMTDVDLNNYQWSPIGKLAFLFGGHFDGNNHTVSNLYINNAMDCLGLFGRVSGGSVENLSVSGYKLITTNGFAGGIIGYAANGTRVKNCHNAVEVSASYTRSTYAGGIIGYADNNVTVTDCDNSGKIQATPAASTSGTINPYFAAGGIIGSGNGAITVDNCYNTGEIYTSTSSSSNYSALICSGGILGNIKGIICVTNSYNTGAISSSHATGSNGKAYAGGISGYGGDTLSFSNCYNTGRITAYISSAQYSAHSYAGGISACGAGTYTGCHNEGYVSATSDGSSGSAITGGISAFNSTGSAFTNCHNSGKLSSNSNAVGGIIGTAYVNDNANTTVTNCSNTGEVYIHTSSSNGTGLAFAGGIVAVGYGGNYGETGLHITNCHNTTSVTVICSKQSAYAGGILGYYAKSSQNSVINCYNTGDILTNAPSYGAATGGIVGYMKDGDIIITNCFNTGKASASSSYNYSAFSGGILGSFSKQFSYYYAIVTNCYNTGTISATKTTYGGGVVGYGADTVDNCYYLSSCGGNNNYGGTSMSGEDMRKASFVSLLNNGSCAWLQDVTPFANDGYPVLSGILIKTTTLNADNVTQSHAVLKGLLQVENDSVTYAGFLYQMTGDTGWTFVKCSVLADTLAFTLSGLHPSTSYIYKTHALSAGCGTRNGKEESFTTQAVSVATAAASNVTQSQATLHGTFNVGDAVVQMKGFEYKLATDTAYQKESVSDSGTVAKNVSGLLPGKAYTYRAFCTMGAYTLYGENQDFTTQDVSVATLPATNISVSSATLNGRMTVGDANVAGKGFRFRPVGDSAFTTLKAEGNANDFSLTLYALTFNTTYEYQAWISFSSAAGTDTYYGDFQRFEVSWLNEDTINIHNADMLRWVADQCNNGNTFAGKYLRLINNIVLPQNVSNNMTAIGSYPDHPFQGTFDGNGLQIANLCIDQPNSQHQGLFGYTDGAVLFEMGLVNIRANGRNYTGGIVGYAANTTIRDCYVRGGSLSGSNYCGGLVGYQHSGNASIISGCYSTCTISGNNHIGGLVGCSNQATVRNSYVVADVSAQGTAVGAIIGSAEETILTNCWFNTDATELSNAIGDNYANAGNEGINDRGMRNSQFLSKLNQGLVTPVWKADYHTAINNGFPILKWQLSSSETCGAPKDLSSDILAGTLTLRWNGGENVKSFMVEYGMVGDTAQQLYTNGRQVQINCRQGLSYFWRVKSICAFGESEFVNGKTVSVGVLTAETLPMLRIYPNPTNGKVNVTGVQCTRLQLFDMYGKLLETIEVSDDIAVLDLSRYAKGLYVIKAWDGNRLNAVGKVMKR